MVRPWIEQIDSFLIFAGLFSGVLTAFIIQSYSFLQQGSDTQAVEILSQISSQLANLSLVTQPPIHVSATDGAPIPFSPSFASITFNALWFTSLACSLFSASISILVKEWLRDYEAEVPSHPREIARTLQFRRKGLLKWRGDCAVLFIAILLQASVALFLADLLCFVWVSNAVVAVFVSAVVCVWVVFWTIASITPSFHTDCPYRSPLSRFVFVLSLYGNCLLKLIGLDLSDVVGLDRHDHWPDREAHIVKMEGRILELDALLYVNEIRGGDSSLERVNLGCIRDIEDGMEFIFMLLAKRSGYNVELLTDLCRTVGTPTTDVLHTIINAPVNDSVIYSVCSSSFINRDTPRVSYVMSMSCARYLYHSSSKENVATAILLLWYASSHLKDSGKFSHVYKAQDIQTLLRIVTHPNDSATYVTLCAIMSQFTADLEDMQLNKRQSLLDGLAVRLPSLATQVESMVDNGPSRQGAAVCAGH
ncbi:hypothetical protein A0H81_02930 [Grifola frondosa]|uniref:DUF6535 domain-containing protein n=1 Tax=Grifola frondosa TaxID=5627 RepID=A0A1C7MI29_GRIFR|nr:hypothetical protein A0H81_02930 [Grifola frondosa]